MTSAHLQSTATENVQVVPVEPQVKSAKTFKLFNAGVCAKAETAKSADPLCYSSPVGAGEAARHGLYDNVENDMTSTAKRAGQSNSDRMHDIEGKHFGQCLAQLWGDRRMTLVELMDYPKARCQVVVVKQFDSPAPKQGASKPWPDLVATYVYVPIEDDGNTWDSLDKALRKFELDRVPAVTNLSLSEVGI